MSEVALLENQLADTKTLVDRRTIAQSAGHLRRFLSVGIQMGNSAENTIADTEAVLKEARAEEDAQ